MPPPTQLRLDGRRRLGRLAVAGLLGLAVGVAAGLLRPVFSGAAVHWEAFAAIFVVLPTVVLGLAWTLRRATARGAATAFASEVAALAVAFAAGWSAVQRQMWPDMLGVTAAFAACAVALGEPLVLLLQRRFRPRADATCPSCGYSLVGAVRRTCPECGRRFDPEEVGVTLAAPIEPGRHASDRPK